MIGLNCLYCQRDSIICLCYDSYDAKNSRREHSDGTLGGVYYGVAMSQMTQKMTT